MNNKNKTIVYFELHFFELKCIFCIFLINYIYIFLICFNFSNELIFLFIQILTKTYTLKYLIFTSITEIFITNIKISNYISFFLSIQTLIILIWIFLYPGLYKHENYNLLKIYIIFFFFNIFIILIIFFKIIPNIWLFFIKNNFSNNFLLNLYFEPKFNNYFSFIFKSFLSIYAILLYIFFFLIFFFFNFF